MAAGVLTVNINRRSIVHGRKREKVGLHWSVPV